MLSLKKTKNMSQQNVVCGLSVVKVLVFVTFSKAHKNLLS